MLTFHVFHTFYYTFSLAFGEPFSLCTLRCIFTTLEVVILRRHKTTKGDIMAQDYDQPKDKDTEDDDEEAVQHLAGAQNDNDGSADDDDDDDSAIADSYELPGADLSNEDSSVTVIPTQSDEFICSHCFLVRHRSQLAYVKDGKPVCKECASDE
jgi:hypothetical protein